MWNSDLRIYANYSFLSVTYHLLAKSLIQERIWSTESCSLYKNKSIISWQHHSVRRKKARSWGNGSC
ncbi:hypothetical protein P8452_76418 [Trifolium repens]|nr:hypothetical protein P8452_76418 [Trifolium repens]